MPHTGLFCRAVTQQQRQLQRLRIPVASTKKPSKRCSILEAAFYDGCLPAGASLLSLRWCAGGAFPLLPRLPLSPKLETSPGDVLGERGWDGVSRSDGCRAAQGAPCAGQGAVLPSPSGRGGPGRCCPPTGPGPGAGAGAVRGSSPSRRSHGRGLREGAHRPSGA